MHLLLFWRSATRRSALYGALAGALTLRARRTRRERASRAYEQ